MLLYLIEHRSDPFDWHDIEALPLYLFALLVTGGLVRLAMELAPATQGMLLKAVLILLLVGLHFLASRRPAAANDGAGVGATGADA